MLRLACAGDHLIKLSISHALSQSTKLCVFEERVIGIVASTKDLPEILASTGAACLSAMRLAKRFVAPSVELGCSHWELLSPTTSCIARAGSVTMPRKAIAQLIGKVRIASSRLCAS